MRPDGRTPTELRPITLIPDFISYPEGSVLIRQGNTHVLCNITIEDGVPRWMQTQGGSGGWISAEYALLPRSTHTRTARETNGLSGRTQEIKRLIGRSLRAAVDLQKLGPRTCTVDCDVLQADGGTRTAAITGSYVALALAIGRLVQQGKIPAETLLPPVAAISVGVVAGNAVLDLCYQEDHTAEVDLNVVMNADGEFIEVQGTAEGHPFKRTMLNSLLDLAEGGIQELFRLQRSAITD